MRVLPKGVGTGALRGPLLSAAGTAPCVGVWQRCSKMLTFSATMPMGGDSCKAACCRVPQVSAAEASAWSCATTVRGSRFDVARRLPVDADCSMVLSKTPCAISPVVEVGVSTMVGENRRRLVLSRADGSEPSCKGASNTKGGGSICASWAAKGSAASWAALRSSVSPTSRKRICKSLMAASCTSSRYSAFCKTLRNSSACSCSFRS
mmetsp:Transcript_108183/g.334114  ORF Transcript_108183/g.334114 Transcript_108183/m.334114 type:complete len:207 (-) Transcript_108183:647-1267(-)